MSSTTARPAAVQGVPAPSPAALRVEFDAHFAAHYPHLVTQLYAITLDAGAAHDAAQEAYSRAWPEWVTIGRSPDPTAWLRRVAVRSTMCSGRSVLAMIGIGRSRSAGTAAGGPRTAAMLGALRRLPVAERRSVVLFHMAGMSMAEIASLERASLGIVAARLSRARGVVSEGMADVLAEVLGPDPEGNQR